MKHLFSLLLLLSLSLNSLAQEHHAPCGTDEAEALLIKNNPALAAQFEATRSALLAQAQKNKLKTTAATVYKIPVVFHVVYNSEFDNISKSQILDGLRVLNEDFRRQNADAVNTRPIFLNDAADIEIEFVLAGKDPSGNCTDGITRTQSSRSIGFSDPDKVVKHWDNTKYCNIWVVNSINVSGADRVLGYAYKPSPGQTYQRDGVVMRHDAIGSIGTAAIAGRLGRTLTHEVGHYLGLDHPFRFGCNNNGDRLADTPPVDEPNYGCNLSANSCQEPNDRPDMVENYMDYSDDVCFNMFTNDQRNVMRASLEVVSLRRNLRIASNHIATGIEGNRPVCSPVASLATPSQTLCPTDQLNFEVLSNGGKPTSWRWYFPGGQPVFSADSMPIVTYPNAGQYGLSVVVSNSAGTDSIYYPNYLKVRPYWTNNNAEWREGFENGLSIPSMSVNSQEDDFTFEATSLAAKTGNNSLYLNNFSAKANSYIGNNSASGDRDEFITPQIFTIFGKGLLMTFDYAFAPKLSTDSDKLFIFVSDDCGATWNQVRLFQGGVLRTAPEAPLQTFVPNSTQWRSGLVPLNGYDDGDPILVKFTFENGGGNNFYMDNINLAASNVSIEEEEDILANISVFPNPSSGAFSVKFSEASKKSSNLVITDLTGKEIFTDVLAEGTTTYEIRPFGSMATGVYLLKIESAASTYTQKLIVK